MIHKHHVRPRYLGGPESPTIELSIEDHAIAHQMLWEEFGNKQDYWAWKGLSGQVTKEEIIAGLISHKGESHPMYGKHHSEETKEKMREAKRRNAARGKDNGGYKVCKGKTWKVLDGKRVWLEV